MQQFRHLCWNLTISLQRAEVTRAGVFILTPNFYFLPSVPYSPSPQSNLCWA